MFSRTARRVRPKWGQTSGSTAKHTQRGGSSACVLPFKRGESFLAPWFVCLRCVAPGPWCVGPACASGVWSCRLVLLAGLALWPRRPGLSFGRSVAWSSCRVWSSGPVVWCLPGLVLPSFRKRRRPRAPTQRPVVSKERRRPKDRSLSRYLPLRQLQYSMAVVLVGLACASASPYSLPVSFLLVLLWSSSQFWYFQRY